MLMGSPATLGAWGATGKEQQIPRSANAFGAQTTRFARDDSVMARATSQGSRGIPRLRDATWAPQRHPGHKERASPTQTKPSRPLLCRAPRPGPRARNDKWGKTRGWLLCGGDERAILHALHSLELDFGFFVVGDVGPGLRNNDERLRAVGQIEGALELQRLNAALLAGVFLQRRFELLRPGMKLVGDLRRQHGDDHGHRALDSYADRPAIVVGYEAAINLQEGSYLVLFLELENPLKLRLDAVFHADPAVILDMNVVGRNEMPHDRTPG